MTLVETPENLPEATPEKLERQAVNLRRQAARHRAEADWKDQRADELAQVAAEVKA